MRTFSVLNIYYFCPACHYIISVDELNYIPNKNKINKQFNFKSLSDFSLSRGDRCVGVYRNNQKSGQVNPCTLCVRQEYLCIQSTLMNV